MYTSMQINLYAKQKAKNSLDFRNIFNVYHAEALSVPIWHVRRTVFLKSIVIAGMDWRRTKPRNKGKIRLSKHGSLCHFFFFAVIFGSDMSLTTSFKYGVLGFSVNASVRAASYCYYSYYYYSYRCYYYYYYYYE